MQNSSENNKRYKTDMLHLLTQIGRLRKKLQSFGYCTEEIVPIILQEFLKLNKIDWENLNSTSSFYDIKNEFRTDSSTTQMLMCLQKIVPNLHAPEVCQYLLTVLEYNAIEFGFNLHESSSDSNESNSALHHRILHHSKRRLKNPCRKQRQRKPTENPIQHQLTRPRKKVHKIEKMDNQQIKENQDKQIKLDQFFSKKPVLLFSKIDEDFQKQLRILGPQYQFQQWKEEEQSQSEYEVRKKNEK